MSATGERESGVWRDLVKGWQHRHQHGLYQPDQDPEYVLTSLACAGVYASMSSCSF